MSTGIMSTSSRSVDASPANNPPNSSTQREANVNGRMETGRRQEAPREEEGTSTRVRLRQASLLPHQCPSLRRGVAQLPKAPLSGAECVCVCVCV